MGGWGEFVCGSPHVVEYVGQGMIRLKIRVPPHDRICVCAKVVQVCNIVHRTVAMCGSVALPIVAREHTWCKTCLLDFGPYIAI